MYSPIAFFLNISIIPKIFNRVATNLIKMVICDIPIWSSDNPASSRKLGIKKRINPKINKTENTNSIAEIVIIPAPNLFCFSFSINSPPLKVIYYNIP